MDAGRLRSLSSVGLAICTLLFTGASVLAGIHPAANAGNAAEASIRRLTLQQFERAEDGDLVFRQGRDVVSRIVLSQSDTPQYSHVGVIVKYGALTMVVHALPKEGSFAGGVVVEPLDRFASMENASSVGLYRVDGVGAKERRRVREFLFSQIGKPFDDSFSMKDDSAMYCTELAVKAYASARIDLAGRVGRVEVMTLPEPVVLPDALSTVPGVSLVFGV